MINHWDKMYIDMATRVAMESKCPRTQVGCVVLLPSGLLATGINGFPAGQEEWWNDGSVSNPLVTHAELNALGKCLEQGVSAKDATVYLTLAPCLECSKLLVRAKVSRVVYKDSYRCLDGVEYLQRYGVLTEQFKPALPPTPEFAYRYTDQLARN